MARVLGRVRLSRLSEESTSDARQRESIEKWADLHGHDIAGWAVDHDVSGSVPPFETPGLGPWLNHRAAEWDILVAWKLDRLGRTLYGLNDLFKYCQENGKILACVSDGVDLSNWSGRLIASVLAGVAEGELEAIRERTGSSRAKLRTLGRWAGGTAPYGYTAVKNGDGWRLEVDPEQSVRVREVVCRALNRESIRSIADRLNDDGATSPRGGKWTAQTITRMLRSRWIIGQTEHNGQVVRGEDHLPLQVAEPLIDFETWSQVQAILDDRKRPKKRKNDPGLLLNVAYCAACGDKLYHNVMVSRGVSYRYWRCSGNSKKKLRADGTHCDATGIPADLLEKFTAERLLMEIGGIERTELIYVPAEGYAEEIKRLADAISTVRKEKDLGLYEGDDAGYFSRLSQLTNRKRELEQEPGRPAGWERRGLGETYADAWERMGAVERRELLLDVGARLEAFMFGRHKHAFELHLPLDTLAASIPAYELAKPGVRRVHVDVTATGGEGLEK